MYRGAEAYLLDNLDLTLLLRIIFFLYMEKSQGFL